MTAPTFKSPDPRYVVEQLLGSGGMGDAWLARDVGPGSTKGDTVVIKVLRPELTTDPESVARFDREAAALAELTDERIVRLRHWGKHVDGRRYLIMDHVSGADLYEVLESEGALPMYAVIALGIDMAAALQCCHDQGLVHRDIKPENIILTRLPSGAFDRATLIDFGIAKRIGTAAEGQAPLTAAGVMLGTPHYMPPEQARGDAFGPAGDIYSLGCVLYHAATARTPFDGNNPISLMTKHMFDAPDMDVLRRAGYSKAFVQLLDSMLAKEAAQRPQSAAEVVRMLRHVARATPAPSAPVYVLDPSMFAAAAGEDRDPGDDGDIEIVRDPAPAEVEVLPVAIPRRVDEESGPAVRTPPPPMWVSARKPARYGQLAPLKWLATAVVGAAIAAAVMILAKPGEPERQPLSPEMARLQTACDDGNPAACLDLIKALEARGAPGDAQVTTDLVKRVQADFDGRCADGHDYFCEAGAALRVRHREAMKGSLVPE